jgi:hypothetical protein
VDPGPFFYILITIYCKTIYFPQALFYFTTNKYLFPHYTFRSGFFHWSIKHWFHTEGKLTSVLIIPSSWGFPTGPVRHQLSKAFLLDPMLLPLLCASGKIKASSDRYCCLHYLLHLFDAILPPTSAAIGNRYFLLYSTSVSRYFL